MIFGRCPNDGEPADPAVLPVLLRFREGEQLLQLDEQVAKAVRPPVSATAVGVECAARGRLFEAAAGKRLAPWDLLKLGDNCACFSEALLRHLAVNGWEPVAATLGAEVPGGKARFREEGADVSTLDMGMFTEAAPSTVRVGELRTVLRCRRSGAPSGVDVDELALELEGPGEAVLLACWGNVPLEAAGATWESRACDMDRLPECLEGSDCDLRAALSLAARIGA